MIYSIPMTTKKIMNVNLFPKSYQNISNVLYQWTLNFRCVLFFHIFLSKSQQCSHLFVRRRTELPGFLRSKGRGQISLLDHCVPMQLILLNKKLTMKINQKYFRISNFISSQKNAYILTSLDEVICKCNDTLHSVAQLCVINMMQQVANLKHISNFLKLPLSFTE